MTQRNLALVFAATCLGIIAPALAVDTDGDGVDDASDICCGTPPGTLVDAQGRPAGDLDGDCDCDLLDYAILELSFTGPLNPSCCITDGDCDSGQFCNSGAGNCGGEGVCAGIPASCLPLVDPVCGCNGVTYDSVCHAAQFSVSVAYAGACAVDCTMNSDCGISEFCDKATGDCGGVGACEAVPPACPDVYAPVCGCDIETYTNECYADQAGVNVIIEGECPTTCSTNADCGGGEYCEHNPCLAEGLCAPIPVSCPVVVDPVCGCDGQTYTNACLAAQAGVSVVHAGGCACSSNGDCGAGEYCEKAAGDCGGFGACDDKPLSCPGLFDPVCGCDNVSYNNACEAAQAGASVNYTGLCTSR